MKISTIDEKISYLQDKIRMIGAWLLLLILIIISINQPMNSEEESISYSIFSVVISTFVIFAPAKVGGDGLNWIVQNKLMSREKTFISIHAKRRKGLFRVKLASWFILISFVISSFLYIKYLPPFHITVYSFIGTMMAFSILLPIKTIKMAEISLSLMRYRDKYLIDDSKNEELRKEERDFFSRNM